MEGQFECQFCRKITNTGEVCSCNSGIADRELPKEGGEFMTVKEIIKKEGFKLYVKPYKYPYKGYPQVEIVRQNATAKRALIVTLKTLSRFPFVLVTPLFLIPYLNRKLFNICVNWFSEISVTAFRDFYVWYLGKSELVPDFLFFVNGIKRNEEPIRFCKSGQELLRVGMKMIKDVKPHKLASFAQAVVGVVMFWELDSAYRLRGQDILGELNKDNLNKNPRKEIIRIIKIGIERERCLASEEEKKITELSFRVEEKLILLLKALRILLFTSPFITKILVEFLNELNIEEIKLDEADRYWCANRIDYLFEGKPHNERKDWRKEIDKDTPIEIIELPDMSKPQLRVEGNEGFFTNLPLEKANELASTAFNALINQYKKVNNL